MSAEPTQPPYPGAIPPPPGVEPNTKNPINSQHAAVVGATTIMIIVPTVAVILRLYTKARFMKKFSLSDACCTIDLILYLGMCGIALFLTDTGMGIHGWDVSPAVFSHFLQYNNYHQILYGPSIFFAKVAVLLQFKDIFVTKQRSSRWWIIWGLILFNLAFCGSILFIIIFECSPRKKIWEPTLAGTCIQQQKMFVGSSVINIIDDFVLLILPLFWISKLQTDIKRKIGVASIFALGIFACVTSIMRLIVSVATFHSMDLIYLVAPVALWAMAEVGAGLLVACLPVLPRLFRRSMNQPSKVASQYAGYAKARPEAHKRYVEMEDDEVQLKDFPSTQTSVFTPDHNTFVDGKSGSQIHRTISIHQTSDAV